MFYFCIRNATDLYVINRVYFVSEITPKSFWELKNFIINNKQTIPQPIDHPNSTLSHFFIMNSQLRLIGFPLLCAVLKLRSMPTSRRELIRIRVYWDFFIYFPYYVLPMCWVCVVDIHSFHLNRYTIWCYFSIGGWGLFVFFFYIHILLLQHN